MPLMFAHRRVTPTAHLFSLSGDLTAEDALALERELMNAVAEGGRLLVVDVSRVRSAEVGAFTSFLRTSDRLLELDGEILLATRDSWGADYVVGALDRDTLRRAATVVPSLAHAIAA